MVQCTDGQSKMRKNKALAQNGGAFETKMVLSSQAISDLHWWSRTLPSSTAPMYRHTPDYIVETDASTEVGVLTVMAALRWDNGPTKRLFIILIILNSNLASLLCNHSFQTTIEL